MEKDGKSLLSNIIADKLKNLESANQRLQEEKSSLQRQLDVVLNRLADGRIPVSQFKADEKFSRLETLLKSTVQANGNEKIDQKKCDAPIAKMEYLGFRDSISTDGSNSLLNNKYSSLSDTYEEFCLKNDFTDQVRMSNISSVKYEYESYFDEHLPQELILENCPDTSKSRATKNMIVDSVISTADTVAESSRHESKASTPVSMLSNESSKYISKQSFQDTETIVSSYSSSSDENLFVNRFHELKKQDHHDMKKTSRHSCSLPASLQMIDKKTCYFIENNLPQANNKLTSQLEETKPKNKELSKLNGKYTKLNMFDSKTQIIRSSSPRHKPPTIKISRKRYEPQNVSSLLSVTTNENSDETPNKLQSKHVIVNIPRTPVNGVHKIHSPTSTDQSFMNNHLLSSVYKTQPLIKIGNDFDFLNNFQNIPSILSSDLQKFPDIRKFIDKPGFGELIRFHEIFATVKSKSFLVQRVVYNPSIRSRHDFKDENLFSLIFGKSSEITAEINRKIASIMMESSSDAGSTIFCPAGNFNEASMTPKTRKKEIARDSLSVLSLDYYQPPSEDDQDPFIGQEDSDMKNNTPIARKAFKDNQVKKVIFSGYISKLGNKFKIWHRFWCELTNVGIFFFKKKTKSKESPTKCIYLSEIKSLFRPLLNSASLSTEKLNANASKNESGVNSRQIKGQNMTSSAPIKRRDYPLKNISHHHLITSSNVPFFEIILNSGKIFTLKSETLNETEKWLTSIRQILKRHQAEKIIDEFNGSVQMQGWMKRIKSGQSRKVWCKLYNHFLIYYRSENDENPIGYRSLIGSKLKLPSGNLNDFLMMDKPENTPTSGRTLKSFKMQNVDFSSNIFSDGFFSSDSDSDIGQQSWTDRNRTFSIWVPNKDPLYLIPPNIEEFEKWKHYLLRACNFSPINANNNSNTNQISSQIINSNASLPKLTPYQVLANDWHQLVRPVHANSFYHVKSIISEPVSRTTEDVGEAKIWRRISELLFSISYPQNTINNDSIDNLSILPTVQYTPRDPRYQTACVSRKYSGIKSLTDICFNHPELKDEFYLQLIRQCNPSFNAPRVQINLLPGTNLPKRRVMNNLFCTRRRSIESLNSEERFKSPISEDSHKNELYSSILLAWECLSLIIPIFLPSPVVLSFLETFLTFHGRFNNCKQETLSGASVNSSSYPYDSPRLDRNPSMLTFELGKYAAFCYEMMERIKLRGHRLMTPSGLEVAAISMRNPYTYSLPFSLPIHLPSPGLYEVISFDGTTRVSNIINRIQEQLGLKEAVEDKLCICSLYCKLPTSYFSLGIDESMSLCDVISSYEQVVSPQNDKHSTNNSLELSFRVQSFSQKLLELPVDRKTLPLLTLLVRQFHLDFIHGDFYSPLRGVDMLDITCYILSMDRGHYNKARDANLLNELKMFLPKAWIKKHQNREELMSQLKECLIERWIKISQMLETCMKNSQDFQGFSAQSYLLYLKRICPQRFSCRLYACRMLNYGPISDKKVIWIAPCSDRINFIYFNNSDSKNTETMPNIKQIKSISLPFLVSYGLQSNGIYFFVYRTLHLPAISQNQSQKTPKEVEQKVDKLSVLISDPCSAKELTNTLRFLCNGLNF